MTIGSRRPVHRRRFLASAGALLAAPAMAGMPIPGALAQQTGQAAPLNPYRELGAIAAEAERLGLSVPRLSAGVEGGTDFDKLMPAMRNFFYDVTQSLSAPTFAALRALAPPEQLLFGSDCPFAKEPQVRAVLGELERLALPAGERAKLEYGNALALFPRLA